MIQDFTFIYLDFKHTKEDKTGENEAKKVGGEIEINKTRVEVTFWI